MKKTCILFLVSIVAISWLCIPGLSRLMEKQKNQAESSIETTNLIKVSIINDDDYMGKAILTVLTANGPRYYTYPITLPAHQVQIDGKQINSARLDPEFLPENGKKYRILINEAGNECKIIPIEEKKLAIVVFITNSRNALKKQDVIDQAIRSAFASKKNFKVLYIGWVRYKKYDFEMIELKNNNEPQINISDVNINDTADASLNKIIKIIKEKFTWINVENGEKQTDRLVVILDKKITYLKFQDYSSQDLKVKLIDFNEIIYCPNGQFFGLIKEN